MPQIPEQIRPVLAAVVKHHFWLLAVLAPLILLPLLFVARSALLAEIRNRRAEIKGRFDALQQVRGIEPHPNADWKTEIEAATARVRGETLKEWERFWQSQESIRVWPAELGEDFLADVAGLKAEGKLRRNLLQRYQNKVPELVRRLPALMQANDAMTDERPAGGREPAAGGAVVPPAPETTVTWDDADQKRLLSAFKWEQLPASELAATTQVVLAQEELWVYGLLCEAIARANQGATGSRNAAVVRVKHLAVGYPAVVEPAAAGGRRILLPKETAPAAEGAGGEQPGSRKTPAHPRFGGEGGRASLGSAGGGEGGTPPEMRLREWIYVDFDGRPLSAAELATSPAARMTHLVPFVLRVVMDQRRLDPLLVDLARSPVPIDVREVRINPEADSDTSVGSTVVGQAEKPGGRMHDVVVELRGTVGLATPPNAAAVGSGQPAPPPAAHLPRQPLPFAGREVRPLPPPRKAA